MEAANPYTILGVEASSDGEELKAAYRFLSKKYHPDFSGDSRTALRFSRVVKAYKFLDLNLKKDKLLSYEVRSRLPEHDIFSLGSIALTSPDAALRRSAVRRLGFSGKKASYVFLRRALADGDESVVIAAVRSIADLSLFQAEGEMTALWVRGSQKLRTAVLDVAEATGERLFRSVLAMAASEDAVSALRAKRLLAAVKQA